MADFENGDVVRLGLVTTFAASDDIVNVLHLTINGGGPMAFAAAAVEFQEYCDVLMANITARQTNLITPVHISVKNVTQDQVWGNIAWSVYAGGANVGDPTPTQLACLAWGRTPISRVQIRKYLGVFTEVECTSGVWTGTVTGACTNYMTYHIQPQTMSGGLILQGCAYNYSLARVTYAVSATAGANPVVQRRRRRFRGS